MGENRVAASERTCLKMLTSEYNRIALENERNFQLMSTSKNDYEYEKKACAICQLEVDECTDDYKQALQMKMGADAFDDRF